MKNHNFIIKKLSICILTKNEAHRIRPCLESAKFADEIIIVDSGSTDDTVSIGRNFGAKVHTYEDWQGFGIQRNRQLAHAAGDYILFLDADEVIDLELRAAIEAVLAQDTFFIGEIRFTEVAFNQPLPWYRGDRKDRLYPRHLISNFEGVVHEVANLSDTKIPRKLLKGKILHYSRFSVHTSLIKLTQYAMLGASKRALREKKGGVVRGLFSATACFIKNYIFRLGFLGGGAGFLQCYFLTQECFFRYAALHYDFDKLREDVGR